MNSMITDFLESVCARIKYKKIHEEITAELNEHIVELVEVYKEQGLGEDESVQMALEQMGDPNDIGIKLHNQYKPETEWSLLGLVALLVTLGGVIMAVCTQNEAKALFDNLNFYIAHYLRYLPVGIIMLSVFYFSDYMKLKQLSMPIYIGTILAIIITILFGRRINGAPWFIFGGVGVAPKSYAAALFLIAFAGFIEKYKGQGVVAIVKLIMLCIVSMVMLLMVPSLAMTFVLGIGYAVMLTVAIARRNFKGKIYQYLAMLYGVGFSILTFVVATLNPHQIKRFTLFLNAGAADKSGNGFVNMMIEKWLSASQLIGKANIDMSYPNGHVFPGTSTNFLFVNIIANFGWIAGIALVIIIASFILRMFLVTGKIRNDYGFYLSLALSTVISLQFIISILVNLNLFPMTEMNMPFISPGATNFVVNMMLVGMLLSIWRMNNLIKASKETIADTQFKFITYEEGKIIINLR